MEINRNAPATAEGELRIDADPQTVFAVISASTGGRPGTPTSSR